MNYREITLFYFKQISDITLDFNRFADSVKDFPYKLEYGAYESPENLNRGYNYLLKITSDNFENLSLEFEIIYKKFLENISLLNEQEFISLAYKPLQLCVNEKNSQKKPKINHTVFLEFKEACVSKTIDMVFDKLVTLFPSVLGAFNFRYGKRINTTPLAKGYVFEMQFLDASARNKYLKQKEHEEVVAFTTPLLKNKKSSIIAFDYKLLNSKFEVKQHLIPSEFSLASTGPSCVSTSFEKEEDTQSQVYRN